MTVENGQYTATEELKPFAISDGETFTPEERDFLKSGAVPEGFKVPDNAELPPEARETKAPARAPAVKESQIIDDPDADPDQVTIVGSDGKPRGRDGKFVPHQALHAEREEHKKTRAELQATRDRYLVGETRLRTLYESAGVDFETGKPVAAPTKSPLEEATIAFSENPIEAWNQQQRRMAYLAEQLTDREKKIQNVEQRLETGASNAQTKQWLENDIRSFASKEPAFGMAWSHVVEGLRKELIVAGVPETEVERELSERQESFVKDARAKGKSAAQLIWALAEARGFKKPDIEIGPDGKPMMRARGPAPGTQEAANKIAAIKSGQQASASLSGVGGSQGDTLTLSRLADMSEEEYASVRRKLGKNGMKQYLGA